MNHLIPARKLDLVMVNKKKRTGHLVDFAVSANYKIKMKESEKINKYLDLAREMKQVWNMKVTMMLVVT